jgi:hypothetical protein
MWGRARLARQSTKDCMRLDAQACAAKMRQRMPGAAALMIWTLEDLVLEVAPMPSLRR